MRIRRADLPEENTQAILQPHAVRARARRPPGARRGRRRQSAKHQGGRRTRAHRAAGRCPRLRRQACAALAKKAAIKPPMRRRSSSDPAFLRGVAHLAGLSRRVRRRKRLQAGDVAQRQRLPLKLLQRGAETLRWRKRHSSPHTASSRTCRPSVSKGNSDHGDLSRPASLRSARHWWLIGVLLAALPPAFARPRAGQASPTSRPELLPGVVNISSSTQIVAAATPIGAARTCRCFPAGLADGAASSSDFMDRNRPGQQANRRGRMRGPPGGAPGRPARKAASSHQPRLRLHHRQAAGYIVTNNHVIDGADEINVILHRQHQP